MGKLGKIFGILVVVLAIAVAALSFLLSKHRNDFRDRAAILAEGVSEASKALSTSSGKNPQATFTPAPEGGKEDGKLGWGSYKDDPSGYKGVVTEVAALAKDVVAQRNTLAEALQEITTALEYPEDLGESAEEVKNLKSYKANVEKILLHVNAVKNRDEALCRSLVKLKKALDVSDLDVSAFRNRTVTMGKGDDSEEEPTKEFGEYPVNVSLKALENAANQIGARCLDYERCFADMMAAINSYEWGETKAMLEKVTPVNYTSVLEALKVDAEKINEKIKDCQKQIGAYKADLKKANDAIADRNAVIVDLKKQLAVVTAERDELRKYAEYYAFPINAKFQSVTDKVVALEGKEQANVELAGAVTEVNEEYNYIVINLGKDKLAPGLMLAVSTNDRYVCTAKVSDCKDYVSLAEVVTGKISDIKVGSGVYFSSQNVVSEGK